VRGANETNEAFEARQSAHVAAKSEYQLESGNEI
jgi:hypothetical protein